MRPRNPKKNGNKRLPATKPERVEKFPQQEQLDVTAQTGMDGELRIRSTDSVLSEQLCLACRGSASPANYIP